MSSTHVCTKGQIDMLTSNQNLTLINYIHSTGVCLDVANVLTKRNEYIPILRWRWVQKKSKTIDDQTFRKTRIHAQTIFLLYLEHRQSKRRSLNFNAFTYGCVCVCVVYFSAWIFIQFYKTETHRQSNVAIHTQSPYNVKGKNQ